MRVLIFAFCQSFSLDMWVFSIFPHRHDSFPKRTATPIAVFLVVETERCKSMKYLTFDWEQLLRDYNINMHAVESLKEQIKTLEKEKINPFIELKGDIEVALAVCKYKLLEYETYVDMVRRGFSVIEEQERQALIHHYMEGKKTPEIAKAMFISDSTCRRLLRDGQRKFKAVVFPD